MITPLIIEYKSRQYDEMITLRHKILREPLGLTFSEKDLEKDRNDFLLAIYISRGYQIAACCILSPIDEKTIQLRQMAVDNTLQNMGLGASMLCYAEDLANKKGYKIVTLNARKTAVGFYQKYGYQILGNEFIEVGIPHYKMEKTINKD